MKKYFLIFLILVFVFGCSYKKELKKKTDLVVIRINTIKEESSDQGYVEWTFTESEDIAEICGFISIIPSPWYKCGYNGSIAFYSNDNLIFDNTARFNLYDECQHIVFTYQGKSYSRKLTNRGSEFLQRLSNTIPEDQRY